MEIGWLYWLCKEDFDDGEQPRFSPNEPEAYYVFKKVQIAYAEIVEG